MFDRFSRAGLLGGAAILALGAGAARAQFVEPDAVALHTFAGAPGETYGWAVADLTDIDGDGVMDAISGAPFTPTLGPRTGRVEVHSGATGAVLHALAPALADSFFGYSIADAGDVDADGVHDIAVGAPRSNGVTGRVFVYSGATGALLHELAGPAGTIFLGGAVSSAGDINGDGHADVLGGAPFFPFGTPDGAAYVFSGADGAILRTYSGAASAFFGFGTALTGDVDGDGLGEHIISSAGLGYAEVYSGGTGALLFTLNAEPTNGAFGQFFVAGAGDVDADCVPDFYVGDFGDDATPGDPVFPRGAAYVFSGADGSRILHLTGAEGDGMGPGRAAGDVNGDGFDDLAIGSYTNSDGAVQGGRVDIVSGRNGAVLKAFTGTVENAQLGFDCVGLGDTNGDDALDFLLSAANGSLVYIGAGDDPVCAADLNGDGWVNARDILIWLIAFKTGGCRGDLDGDGFTDLRDLHLLLGAIGRCG